MRADAHASSDDIDVAMLMAIVRRRLPKLLMLCAFTGATTFVALSLVAPRYVSEAQLAIASKSTANPFADPTRAGGSSDSVSVRMDKEAVNTHVRALSSPDLAARIVSEMKLATRVEFNSALGSEDTMSALLRMIGIGGPRAGESDQDRALSAYFKRLEVYSPKESRFIGIRFSSSDPELAAAVANKIAETYREQLANQSVVETDEVQKALEPKIALLSEEVGAAEAEVERFRGQANIFKGGQQSTGLNEQQLAEMTAELSKVKAARSDAEVRTNSAREMLKTGSADALPDVQKSPLIQNLVQQRVRAERQVSELSATLLPGHPRMRQLNADLAGLKRQIEAEMAKVVDGLAKEAKVAALREEALTRSLNEIKTRIVNTGPDEVRLRSLEANAKSKRAELERLRAQFEANRVTADSRAVPVEAQIVTTARPSSVPVFPKKMPYALLIMVATLLFGLALSVTRGLLAGVRTGGRARQRDLGAGGRDRHEEELSPVVFLDVEPDSPSRVMTVCSLPEIATRMEGMKAAAGRGVRTLMAGDAYALNASEEAIGLALILGAKGLGVIVVDWSPEGGGILGSPSDALGMVDLIEGIANFEDVVECLDESDVHFIRAGRPRAEGAGDLDPDRVNIILDALDEVYDHIVIVGRREAARRLFEAIQGRFDCGIVVSDAKRRTTAAGDNLNTFLGYEVDDIVLIRFERAERQTKLAERAPRGPGAGAQQTHAR
jgi:uncharacterized protein involved in exopolysaccharide biosynthesis